MFFSGLFSATQLDFGSQLVQVIDQFLHGLLILFEFFTAAIHLDCNLVHGSHPCALGLEGLGCFVEQLTANQHASDF